MKPNTTRRTHTSPLLHTPTHLSVLLVTFIVIFSSLLSSAKELELFRTPTKGNTLRLTQRAMITHVNRSKKSANYTIWQNGRAFISISQEHNIEGILPAGTYVLRVEPGASVTIKLSTTFKPKKITLWERHNKLVKPLTLGNRLVLTSPTTITHATYDGTEGFSIQAVSARQGARPNVILRYISPHKRGANGPRVIGGTGGKTVVGQTLPAGVYCLAVGQGKADGIVKATIDLVIK